MKGLVWAVTAPVWIPLLLLASAFAAVMGVLVMFITQRAPLDALDALEQDDG